MTTLTRTSISLYTDRTTKQWVVRDTEGNFWLVPACEDGWARRERIEVSAQMELEPVPGHYKYMLGVPA
jgi:hypothetical protein